MNEATKVVVGTVLAAALLSAVIVVQLAFG
jgi:hypothetical protein